MTSRDFVALSRPIRGQKGSLRSPRGRLVASLSLNGQTDDDILCYWFVLLILCNLLFSHVTLPHNFSTYGESN